MELKAEKRDILGKQVRKLRRTGLLPAVVFGKDRDSLPISLNQKEFEAVYSKAGESTLIDLMLNDKPQKVLVADVVREPVHDKIIHADLHAVKLTEKITAAVPIEIVGESPIIESGSGILIILLDELEVEAFPQNLPAKIPVDITNLIEVDHVILVRDLKVDRSKVELKAEPDEVVLKIDHAEMQEEEAPAAETPVGEAVEITGEKPKTESEEGKEEKTEE